MTKQQIEKAAEEYAEPTRAYLLGEETRQIKEAFVAGASYALQHQWVSVEERLPDVYRTVLAYIDGDIRELRLALARYDGEDWCDTQGYHIHPSHWMYIPWLNNEKD